MERLVLNSTGIVTQMLAANPLAQIAASVIVGAADLSELEKRFPYLLAVNDSFATTIGQACNAWPVGEREKALQRALDKVREGFEGGRESVENMMAKANPLHGLKAGVR